MDYIGISCGFHDAAVSVVDEEGNIRFAAHSERYSKTKHDAQLHRGLINDVLNHCDSRHELHYYERPVLKWMREYWSGARPQLASLRASHIIGAEHMMRFNTAHVHTHAHHLSHAAAQFCTSPFDRATVVVIDAIGEWDCITIWGAQYVNDRAVYKKLWSKTYPDSIGLFYSAMTDRVGLRPRDEEYILMGMSSYGSRSHTATLRNALVSDVESCTFKQNLHIGVEPSLLQECDDFSIARASQDVLEELVYSVMKRAAQFNWSKNLVYGGGVALNCAANRNIGNYFDAIWIMPNPGDAGSSLGAAALGYGRRLKWNDAYLGHDISGEYPVSDAVSMLFHRGLVGVASGREEFGPRALGNRSLLADPRGPEIKDRVNEIKRRQKFRPFAPVILEEHVHEHFHMPYNWTNSRYMQTVARCKHPQLYPAIVHVDGTSRVQTVPRDASGIRRTLEHWYERTGCPMLLNTSLNIRGEPIVHDRTDARRFTKLYDIDVLCST